MIISKMEITTFRISISEEQRSIGRWGRLHRDYLKVVHPALYQDMMLSCTIWTYLADQRTGRKQIENIIQQMKEAEGVTEELKAIQQLIWVQRMNSIRNRAEEIIKAEMIFT